MADFDGLISPAGSWMDIPQLSVMAIAIGGIGGCMNAQAVAIAARLELLRGRSVHGDQFPGIDPTGATDSTAGFVAAKNYVANNGGGIVRLRPGTYVLSNFDVDRHGVIFEGEASGYGYAAVTSGVIIKPGVGAVYAARLKGSSGPVVINAAEGSGFRNLQFLEPVSGVTEYGLFIDSGATLVDAVQISGFQHGCVIADQANQNVFRMMNIILNTKTGFAATEHQGKAYLHPNVTGITAVSNTTFFMDCCAIRQNGFGFILRSAVGARITNSVIESNDQPGLYIYRTNVSSVRGIKFDNVWLENNYQAYTSGSTAFSIAGNNLLKITNSGTYIAWTSLNQAGYQLVIDSQTRAGGGCDTIDFDFCKFNGAGSAQKGILALSGYKIKFNKPWLNGGDVANFVRETSDAVATHWIDPLVGNDPAALATSLTDNFGANGGTCGAYFRSGISGGDLGGVYPQNGVFGGPIHFKAPAAGDPRTADPRCLDDYYENDAFTIAWRLGSAIPFVVNTQFNTVTKIGRKVHCEFSGTLTANAATGASDKLFCNALLPFQAAAAGRGIGYVVIKPTGGGASVLNNGLSPLEMNAIASTISVLDVFPALSIGNTYSFTAHLDYISVT